jgi:hypothetical protein
VTFPHSDGETATLLDEIRHHVDIGAQSLVDREYARAVEEAHRAAACCERVRSMRAGEMAVPQRQRIRLLETELKLLNQRIRLVIGT